MTMRYIGWVVAASLAWVGPASAQEVVVQTPHLTLHRLKDELCGRGVIVSHNAVWTFLRREGLSFKKNTVRS